MNGTIRRGNDLARDPIGKLMLRMSAPTMLAQVVNALYNIVDRIYIGHIPEYGPRALAGLGITFPMIVLISAVVNLVGVGGSTRAAIRMGEGRNEDAEQILGACTALLALLALLLTALLQIFREPLLYLFGASSETITYAVSYLRIYLWGTLPVLLGMGLNPFIAAQGFTKISMCTTLLGALLNILLDPLFIFVLDMGVAGAAAATVLSQLVSAFWVLRFFSAGRSQLRIRRRCLRPQRSILLPVLAIGAAPFVMHATECILNIAFNSSLQRYGGDLAVGAFTIASSATQVMFMLYGGFTQGVGPIVSYNYGASALGRVRKTVRLTIGITVAMGLAIWLALQLFPRFFVLLFNGEAELVSYAVWTLRIYSAGFFALGIQHGCQHMLVALGQTKISLFLALLRKVILLIPLIYILPHLLENPVLAVLAAEPAADILAAAVTGTLFFRRFERILQQRTTHASVERSLS